MSLAQAFQNYSLAFPRKALTAVVIVAALGWAASKSVFYAEPGYIYHVRTVLGSEEVVSDVGYRFYPFGRWNAWKRAMTVQSVEGAVADSQGYAEVESDETSAATPPMSIMFLDQVSANAEATVRFSIPSDRETFLRLAAEYRTPANLLRTALMPAYKETLQATASLMSAEDYYSGSRTLFNTEFEKQMSGGIYQVRREEVVVNSARAEGTANVALGTDQQAFGDDHKVSYEVRKVLDDTGREIRKTQKFENFGISVVDARVTNITPNSKFIERMQLKQKASADRAIAREQRIQEEEQRLLAIARGDREVAERQAKAKVEQIEKTTDAETEKQLALTAANKLKEQAQIERETAAINLQKARIDAETQRTLADAEAYKKNAILKADNALADKLRTEVEIHRVWSEAFAKRAVPTTVFGGGGGVSTGSDTEVKAFMQMLTLDAAKRLSYERDIGRPVN